MKRRGRSRASRADKRYPAGNSPAFLTMPVEDEPAAAAAPETAPVEDGVPAVAVDGSSTETIEWPRCGYCGSTALRESRRGGFNTALLRFAGCIVYRCENCERRFAFATLGHPQRRHHGEKVSLKPREEFEEQLVSVERRRAFGVLATLLAALFTFLAAGWLISRAERRRLEGDGVPPPQ